MTLELTDQEAKIVADALRAYRDRSMALCTEDQERGFVKFANQFRADAQIAATVMTKLP